MNKRFGSNSVVFIRRPAKACQGRLAPLRDHAWNRTKLSVQSNTTSAAAVLSVSHKPHLYAAAVSTNTKNRMNGLLGPSPKTEIKAGQTISAACTRIRNDAVDVFLLRNSISTSMLLPM